MKNHGDVPEALGRRRALRIAGLGIASGGLFVLGGCKGGGSGSGSSSSSADSSGKSCNTPVDEAGKTTRRTLQYQDKAAVPEKNCAACAQFQPGLFGACGGCKVVAGPVRPEGGCLAFAPKTAAPANSG